MDNQSDKNNYRRRSEEDIAGNGGGVKIETTQCGERGVSDTGEQQISQIDLRRDNFVIWNWVKTNLGTE